MTYEGLIDDDVKFIGSTLNITKNLILQLGCWIIYLLKRIANKDLLPGKGFEQIQSLVNDEFKVLIFLKLQVTFMKV